MSPKFPRGGEGFAPGPRTIKNAVAPDIVEKRHHWLKFKFWDVSVAVTFFLSVTKTKHRKR